MPMVRPNHIWYHHHFPVKVVIIVTKDDRLKAVIIFHQKLLNLNLCQDFMDSVVILNLIFHTNFPDSSRYRSIALKTYDVAAVFFQLVHRTLYFDV